MAAKPLSFFQVLLVLAITAVALLFQWAPGPERRVTLNGGAVLVGASDAWGDWHGEVRLYAADGSLMQPVDYRHGLIVHFRCFDAAGCVTSEWVENEDYELVAVER